MSQPAARSPLSAEADDDDHGLASRDAQELPSGTLAYSPAEAVSAAADSSRRDFGNVSQRKRTGRRREHRVVRGPEDRVGEVLNSTYRVERLIAVGGMGAVYEVSHTRLEQHFAVKFLDPSFANNQEAYSRFRREAEIASNLNSRNIIQVFDFNADSQGNPYMVMELVDGKTLDEVLAVRKTLKPDEILTIYRQLCTALDICHEVGIVHRDLKPSNIIVNLERSRPLVKLLDFGISKIKQQEHETQVTRDNVVMGTPNYMSPEQAQGQNKSVDKCTDIFALGAILYELISGRRAFDSDSLPALLHAIVYDEPSKLTNVDSRVYRVIETCLAKDPTQRYQTAGGLCASLEQAWKRSNQVEDEKRAKYRPLWWGGSILATMLGTYSVAASRPVPVPTPVAAAPSEPSRPTASPTSLEVADDVLMMRERVLRDRPTAIFAEWGDLLYCADASGLSYWSDVGAPQRRQALSSAAAVTTLVVAPTDGDVLVGHEDGTVARWDRALQENHGTRNYGGGAVRAISSAADYLAVAYSNELRLVNQVTGKTIRTLPSSKPPKSLIFAKTKPTLLVSVRDDDAEFIDADRRRSLGVIPLGAKGAVRAGLANEKYDQSPVIWIDFVQGEWTIRREYAVIETRSSQLPRLERLTQKIR